MCRSMDLIEHRLQEHLANGTVSSHRRGPKLAPSRNTTAMSTGTPSMSATLLWLQHCEKPEPSSAKNFGRKLFVKSAGGNERSPTNLQQCGRWHRLAQVLSPLRFNWQPKRRILFLVLRFLNIQSKPSSVGSARHSSSSPSLKCGWCHQQIVSLDVLLLKTSLEPLLFGSTEREFTVLIAI